MAALTALTAGVLGPGAVPAAAAAAPLDVAPFISNLVDSGTRVRVAFKDMSYAEDAFQLFRRGLTGSWEYVGEAPTQDQSGERFQAELADPSPNALRCYAVVAYDYAGAFEPAWSRPECVGGGGDPFDTSWIGIPAPRVTSVQSQAGAVTQVMVRFVDRSRTESRWKLFRRQGAVGGFVGEVVTGNRPGPGGAGAFVDTVRTGSNACYSVQAVDDATSFRNYSNEVCLTPPAPLPAPRAGRGSINPVYTGPLDRGSFGGESSVAIGADGLPVVAFRGKPDGSQPMLMVAHCDDPACGSSTTTPLDRDGRFPSLAIGRDGLPVVAYRSVDGVGVAHCSDRACTSAALSVVDQVAPVAGGGPEVSIGADGLPTIAYEDNGRRARDGVTVIKVAHCRNAACTTATVTAVDTVEYNDSGSPRLVTATSSATGLTYVAFVQGVNESNPEADAVLKVATCLNPACTDRSTNAIDRGISRVSVPGTHMSVTVGRDGLPLLSYAMSNGFVVAHCVNVFCTGVTTTFYDDLDAGVVGDTSIAIGADGLGIVSHQDLSTRRVEVTHCADLACSAASLHTIPTGGAGTASIAIGVDGLPVIGFESDFLRLIHCRDVACSGF